MVPQGGKDSVMAWWRSASSCVMSALLGAILGFSQNRFGLSNPIRVAIIAAFCALAGRLAQVSRDASCEGAIGADCRQPNDMTAATCPRCGKPLASDAPGGLCAELSAGRVRRDDGVGIDRHHGDDVVGID